MYTISLNIFYTPPNGELYVPLCNQKDLESAVQLVDQNQKTSSLRIFLTNAVTTASSNTQKSPRTERSSPSPPPGSLPPNERHFSRSSSHSSLGQGQFIPEPGQNNNAFSSRDSLDSLSSIDSSYISGHSSNNTYPARGRRDSRRSVLSDDGKDEDPHARKICGTFPRGYDPVNHHYVENERTGHQTFPRSAIRRIDLETMSVRSFNSRSSADSPSTCSSSSSGLPADPIDIDSPSMYNITSLQFSKSPRCPINWKKGKQLGVGAFGEVFMCYDVDSGVELAVKQVQLGDLNAETSKEVRALENELQLLKNFQHERIVQYFGCQQDNKVLSIFIELMPGGSVKDHINQYGALKEIVTKKYTKQMLEGLAFLHMNVIVHRDIKAANVLRDLQGNIKLADFGASKRLQTICSASNLKTALGTPHWMAPEVINGEGYGRKADVWSLGCTIVEMLTKKPPFAEYESFAAMFQIATCKYPKYDLPPDTSVTCREFLSLTFQRTGQERPSADDLLRHRFLNGVS
ncbi:mitogen-activated protein kinase kinase kinase 2-like isoform X2 [Gigantopelta aegis]|uniref:mitogen-activated protein kinase kinase kinase 2-like isoform X2 n=1 Tax=Gigantopelta aegis TaxID=1735272 RepID=UPI001B888C35|nr:mitogen-activated protein kinase kinase kinase 2-like isoform X2 [Gigantopelta aegis]